MAQTLMQMDAVRVKRIPTWVNKDLIAVRMRVVIASRP